MGVAFRAAVVSSRGKIVGSRAASIVFPPPGGLSSDRLSPPAARISTAIRASA
jgi:hypothetical protein